jgi:hypothetical protein
VQKVSIMIDKVLNLKIPSKNKKLPKKARAIIMVE